MDTPGYDPVSATGQVAGGANVLCFTTGRGSAYGCKPTPSIKIATNSDIYHKMIDDMDINGGEVVEGGTLEAKGQEIFDTILRVASGEKSKSEELGYGDNEFVPWESEQRSNMDTSARPLGHRHRLVPRHHDLRQEAAKRHPCHHGWLGDGRRQFFDTAESIRRHTSDRRSMAEGAADRGDADVVATKGVPHRPGPNIWPLPPPPRRGARRFVAASPCEARLYQCTLGRVTRSRKRCGFYDACGPAEPISLLRTTGLAVGKAAQLAQRLGLATP